MRCDREFLSTAQRQTTSGLDPSPLVVNLKNLDEARLTAERHSCLRCPTARAIYRTSYLPLEALGTPCSLLSLEAVFLGHALFLGLDLLGDLTFDDQPLWFLAANVIDLFRG